MKVKIDENVFEITKEKNRNIKIIISEKYLINIAKDIINNSDGKILVSNIEKTKKYKQIVETLSCIIIDRLIVRFRKYFN